MCGAPLLFETSAYGTLPVPLRIPEAMTGGVVPAAANLRQAVEKRFPSGDRNASESRLRKEAFFDSHAFRGCKGGIAPFFNKLVESN